MFILVSVIKVILKDGFIIYFFLMPPLPFETSSQTLMKKVTENTLTATVGIALIISVLAMGYLGGCLKK